MRLLDILLPETDEGSLALHDRGPSEMKDRLEAARPYDRMLSWVFEQIQTLERRYNLVTPREDRFAILAFYAICERERYREELLACQNQLHRVQFNQGGSNAR